MKKKVSYRFASTGVSEDERIPILLNILSETFSSFFLSVK